MKKPLPDTPRLTRAEFRALARRKGWQFTMLAQRWGVTPEWISHISRDPQRDLRYDDALHGLPNLRHLARDLGRRKREVALAVAGRAAQEAGASGTARSAAGGFRYRGYLVPGAIVTTTAQFGTLAEEGERGIVFQVEDDGKQERYGVIFEQGACDWFAPAHVDAYLATTGLFAARWPRDRYHDAAALQDDFNAGKLDFWPATPTG